VRPAARRWLAGAALRAAGFAALWWALAEGDPAGWYWAAVAVAAATAISTWLHPPRPRPLRPRAVVALLAHFWWQSLRGALDVAWRSVQRRPAIRPGVLTVELDPVERDRVLLAGMISLLPGTVVTEVSEKAVRVHVLDRTAPLDTVVATDHLIRRAFGPDQPPGSDTTDQ
jgi:multicomponent Na+:H+ antiporter subunit E